MTRITRRTAITTALLGAGAACARKESPRESHDAAAVVANAAFAHGVASGDPAADSVVLWTRLTTNGDAPQNIRWEVANDEAFAEIVADGDAIAAAQSDWTVKAVAEGLSAGRRYFYRFRAGDAASPTGKTRTLATGALNEARLAVVSCSNVPFGYFNVYDHIARRDDIDAVLHLGDYIYEYGGEPDQYGADVGARLGRPHQPPHELKSLDDYRARHAQYKKDPGAQAMHAAHPMIAIWDDHETANDSHKDGAQNHDAGEGEWTERKRAALQAYFEWMPIRDPAPGRAREAIFRSFSFGDLMTICALETRLLARSPQIEYNHIVPLLVDANGAAIPEAVARFRDVDLWSADRDMLGEEQLGFLKEALSRSAAAGEPWRLIANQIIMARVTAPNLEPHIDDKAMAELEAIWDQARSFVKFSTLGLPTNLDAWDGYPAAREKFYEMVRATAPEGLVVVTGDTHTWWANNLTSKDGAHLGVELGVHSVTSPSPYRKEFLGGKGAQYALLTGKDNKDVRYISGEDHGYIALTVSRETIDAQFIAVDTIESTKYQSFEKAAFAIRKSGGVAQFAGVRGLSLKERAVF